MSCLSRHRIWLFRRRIPSKRKSKSGEPLTLAAQPSTTNNRVLHSITPSSAVSGSSSEPAAAESPHESTPSSQAVSGAPQTPHIRLGQSEVQACSIPEPPVPYATILDMWHEALGSLKESEKDDDILATERLIGKTEEGQSERPSAENIAMELEKGMRLASKERQHDGKAARIMEKTLPVIKKFATAIDVAVSYDPAHAALPWAAVRFVLTGLTATIDLKNQLLATITIVASLFVQCEKYQQLYLSPDLALRPPHNAMEELKTRIIRSYVKSLAFLSFTHKWNRSKTKYLAATYKHSDAENYVHELSECEENLLRAAEYCEKHCESSNRSNVIELLETSKASHQSIHDEIKIILDQMGHEEHIRMLEWISHVRYGKHHKRVNEARTSGTCEWLLRHEKFREWEGANSPVVLWLQGSPGAGKTFLTSKVIDHTRDWLKSSRGQEGFAFFYCDRNDEERRNPLSILQSFVRQLSTTLDSPWCVRPTLLELYKKRRQHASEFGFDDCAKQILESVKLFRKTTIVLDALDECDPASRKKIIKVIEDILSTSQQTVRVFISSRPDRDVRSRFLGKPNIEIQATHTKEDVKKFVNEEIINHGGWQHMSAKLQNQIVTVLLDKSQGMFQWVFLQIKQLLDLETEAAILDRLGKLPEDLKTTYDEIYNRIKTRNDHDKAITDNAFKWVMCADLPLTSEELLPALRIDSRKETFELSEPITEYQLLHLCNNLLVIDSEREVWRFSHLSVAEYFEEHHWSRAKAHSNSAKVCLKFLMENYANYEYQGSRFIGNTMIQYNYLSETPCDKPDDIFHLNHPFYIYAHRHWVTHIQAQEEDVTDPTLTQLLKSFLGSPEQSSPLYRRWCYNLERTGHYELSLCRTDSLLPQNVVLFVMCQYSFYNVLLDWWENAEFDASWTNKQNESLLILAIKGGCLPICKNLIRRGVDVNSPVRAIGSALGAAVQYQRINILDLLLSEGADANMQLWNGLFGSALALAAAQGDTEIVRILVDAGADVNMQLLHGQYGSALVAAACFGNINNLKFLVEQAGADINMQVLYGDYGNALVAAACYNHTDSLKFLTKQTEADINMQVLHGDYGSALSAAAYKGAINNLQFLIEQVGADINMQVLCGHFGSALVAAACCGHINSLKFLTKQAKADINMQVLHGNYGSALAAAAHNAQGTENLQLLIKLGADVNMQLLHGKYGSALAAAAHNGDTDKLQFLIEMGADVNMRLLHGKYSNALMAACMAHGAWSADEAVELLVIKGAHVNQQVQDGAYGTALAAAAFWGNERCARILIEAGADVNLIIENGVFRTALQACLPSSSQRKALFRWDEEEE